MRLSTTFGVGCSGVLVRSVLLFSPAAAYALQPRSSQTVLRTVTTAGVMLAIVG